MDDIYTSIWYENLNKPFLNPPDFIFPPVWTVLYAMILLSFLFLVKANNSNAKIIAVVCFLIQMFFNLSWTPVFFHFQNIGGAFIIICFMLLFTCLTIIKTYPISKVSAYLLIPYLVWIAFAGYLNFMFMILN